MRIRKFNSSLFVNVPDKPKARSPIKKVSAKQQAREKHLAAMKKAWIAEQFRLHDCAWCQGPCRRTLFDEESARRMLDGHHRVLRSQGGTDEPDNITYLCRECHQAAHGIPPTKRGG